MLTADVSEAGEGWSDRRIAEALEALDATVERTKKMLVEQGLEAVLSRKYNSGSARPRTFDGEAEAKLIALTRGPAPERFSKWSIRGWFPPQIDPVFRHALTRPFSQNAVCFFRLPCDKVDQGELAS